MLLYYSSIPTGDKDNCIEVAHTIIDKTGFVLVHITDNNSLFECYIPSLAVIRRDNLSDGECDILLDYVRRNYEMIMSNARVYRKLATIRGIHVKWFVNYRRLYKWIELLKSDYNDLGYSDFMKKEYEVFGLYKNFLLGYKQFLYNNKHDLVWNIDFCAKRKHYVLMKEFYLDFVKYGRTRTLLDNKEHIIPELYNFGFIFTSI